MSKASMHYSNMKGITVLLFMLAVPLFGCCKSKSGSASTKPESPKLEAITTDQVDGVTVGADVVVKGTVVDVRNLKNRTKEMIVPVMVDLKYTKGKNGILVCAMEPYHSMTGIRFRTDNIEVGKEVVLACKRDTMIGDPKSAMLNHCNPSKN
jgi:hypothetical protein